MQLRNSKAIREVRTKETFKNNKLTPFVQYEKQPANRSLQYFIYSNLSSAKNNHSSLRGTVSDSDKLLAQCYSEHQRNFSPMMRLPDNIGLVGLAQKQSAEYFSKRSQPFGVMPRDFNSFLSIRLIQVAKDKSPSLEACSSSCALNCSGRRIWYCGDFFNSCIDMCNYPLLALLYGSDKCNYFIAIKQRSPVVLPTHTEPLTTNDRSCIEVAMYKYTQTHPKFTDTYWIIRLDSNIPYGKVSLTRRERRLFTVLFKDDRLVWSGRKPITPQSIIECSASQRQEVAHA